MGSEPDRALAERRDIPPTIALRVSCTAEVAFERLRGTRGVQGVDRMPAADAPRSEYLAITTNGAVILMKAPHRIHTPFDEVGGPLQHLQARIIARDVYGGAVLSIEFRWRPARFGYLTLYPMAIALWGGFRVYGIAAAVVVVVFAVAVHWPRYAQERRRELLSKLSDALGPVLVDGADGGPYR